MHSLEELHVLQLLDQLMGISEWSLWVFFLNGIVTHVAHAVMHVYTAVDSINFDVNDLKILFQCSAELSEPAHQ